MLNRGGLGGRAAASATAAADARRARRQRPWRKWSRVHPEEKADFLRATRIEVGTIVNGALGDADGAVHPRFAFTLEREDMAHGSAEGRKCSDGMARGYIVAVADAVGPDQKSSKGGGDLGRPDVYPRPSTGLNDFITEHVLFGVTDTDYDTQMIISHPRSAERLLIHRRSSVLKEHD